MRLDQDSTNVKEASPLLPLLDEETQAILEEKGLLIPRECLTLGEVVGQGQYLTASVCWWVGASDINCSVSSSPGSFVQSIPLYHTAL